MRTLPDARGDLLCPLSLQLLFLADLVQCGVQKLLQPLLGRGQLSRVHGRAARCRAAALLVRWSRGPGARSRGLASAQVHDALPARAAAVMDPGVERLDSTVSTNYNRHSHGMCDARVRRPADESARAPWEKLSLDMIG